MAPGARSKYGAPMFEPEVFQKQIHCIEESSLLVTLLGLFSAPSSDSAPGELCPPCSPSLRPCIDNDHQRDRVCRVWQLAYAVRENNMNTLTLFYVETRKLNPFFLVCSLMTNRHKESVGPQLLSGVWIRDGADRKFCGLCPHLISSFCPVCTTAFVALLPVRVRTAPQPPNTSTSWVFSLKSNYFLYLLTWSTVQPTS